MSSDLTVILVALLVIGLPVAVMLFIKRRREQERSRSTCGETSHPGGTLKADAWFIGPVLSDRQGGNKSPGMPPHPTINAGAGWHFDVPVGENLPLKTGSKVDYVTFRHGPLTGKKQIRLRYRLTGGTVLSVPEVDPAGRWPAHMNLYFQREGDNWTAAGKYETYRWYATGHAVRLAEGEHEIVVPLDAGWTATQTSTSVSNPAGFKDAVDNACCLGVVFGGNEVGWGHGMRSTGPARFEMLDFRVE